MRTALPHCREGWASAALSQDGQTWPLLSSLGSTRPTRPLAQGSPGRPDSSRGLQGAHRPHHCPAQVCRGPELRPLPPPPARTCSGPVSGGALLSSIDPSFSRSTAGSQFKDSSALETSGNGLRPFLGPRNLQTTQACTRDAAQLGTGRHWQGSTQQWGTGPELSPWRRRQGPVASGSRAVQPPAHSGPH